MGEAFSARENNKNAYNLVGKARERRPLEIIRGTWKDNIKMDLNELECDLN